jgi:hypothetical protein
VILAWIGLAEIYRAHHPRCGEGRPPDRPPTKLAQERAGDLQPTVHRTLRRSRSARPARGTSHIWLGSKGGTNERGFTKMSQAKESVPHFLRDSTVADLRSREKEGGGIITQMCKGDLVTSKVTSLTGTDADYAASLAAGFLALE